MIRGPRAILALLTALNLLNYLDRFVLPAVLKEVKQEFHLSGWLAGNLATVFLIGYFATSPIFGAWSDRVGHAGRKGLLALGIGVWSFATVATGLSAGVGGLVAARAFVGVGEASYATISPAVIDDIAPPSKKGGWLSVFFAAIPIGSALGYLVGGAVFGMTHSWRSVFFLAGGPGLVLALTCLLIGEPPRSQAAEARPCEERPDVLGSLRTLRRCPLYVNTALGYCAYTFALGGFAFWAPYYISTHYDVPTERASFTFGLVTVVGGAAGTFLGGWLGDRWARGKTDDDSVARAALRVCTLSSGLGAPLAAIALWAPSANLFYALVLLTEVALFLHFGPFNVAILRSVPLGLRASAMALSIFASHALGDLWSPFLIGLVNDHAPMVYAMLLIPAAFALAALVWSRPPPGPSGDVSTARPVRLT